ncbi:MAG: ABC transporter permease [Oscillospiraceae bacterium]|nr:ABC transporter permease [Oscillospiraceae bacterium]
MRRAGKWTALLLVAFILGLVYLSYRLISQSQFYMAKSGGTTYGKVVDRSGDVLFDGTQPLTNYGWGHFADVGNFIGDTSGQMSNTIVAKNLSDLANYSFTYGNNAGTAVLETTLSHSANQAVFNAYGLKNGTTIAYNWKTGEVLVCVSKPCVDIALGYDNLAAMPEGSLLCKAFYPTVPGSTQKVSTLLACYEYAGVDQINALEFNCAGEWANANGDIIKCHNIYGHGTQNLTAAFANSCNPYFAQLVQSGRVPLSAIITTYTRMGYAVNGGKANAMSLNGITIPAASTTLKDKNQFETQWGTLGQGKTLVSPYQLMLWQGAVASGTGSAVQPYLLRSKTSADKKTTSLVSSGSTGQLFMQTAAKGVQDVMVQNAANNYAWALSGYNCGVKSGTAQVNDDGQKYENSLLVGFCLDDSCPIAFCIQIEARESWDVTTGQIARTLLDALAGVS